MSQNNSRSYRQQVVWEEYMRANTQWNGAPVPLHEQDSIYIAHLQTAHALAAAVK